MCVGSRSVIGGGGGTLTSKPSLFFECGEFTKGSCCEFTFNLPQKRSRVFNKGTCFYNGDQALRVKRWLYQVIEDASGLTLEEWDPAKRTLTAHSLLCQ